MKDNYNNYVSDFRYHVIVSIEENSLREYLQGIYEEEDFSTLHSLEDCMVNQYGELEIDWAVRVYDKHSVNRFVDEIIFAKWSRISKEEYTKELHLMDELTFAIYSDNRDDLNECINHIAEHCKRRKIRGSVSDIIFHVRPIEYGARDF